MGQLDRIEMLLLEQGATLRSIENSLTDLDNIAVLCEKQAEIYDTEGCLNVEASKFLRNIGQQLRACQ
jgi:hypothetical protein